MYTRGMTNGTLSYDSVAEARANFKDLSVAASEGRPARYMREGKSVAVVDLDRLVRTVALLHPAKAEVFHEDDAVGLAIPELGLAVEGDTLDDAVVDMVEALRDYAQDWVDHLRTASNHSDNWGVVQIIEGSDDAYLTKWILGQVS